MQELENAVRDVLRCGLWPSRVMDNRLFCSLQALANALFEHEAKPKHDEWGRAIGDDQGKEKPGLPANVMAHIELLQGSLNIANQDLVSAQNKIAEQKEAIAGESKVSADLRAELAKANAEIARLQGEVSRLQDEIENRIAFGVDAKDSLGKEIQRLQVQLGQQKSYTQSLGEARLRVANERDALRAEVERLQQELRDLKEDRAILMSNAAEIRKAAGTKIHDAIIMKLRDHEAAMRFKREVADIAGTGAYKCDDIRDALKAKVSQLTIQAKDAAEFRAAWAKLKVMFE